ncbi:MAG: FeoA family protein [Gemmatimonadota bacterium]
MSRSLPTRTVPSLAALRNGETAELARLNVDPEAALRLMELGLIPGCRILMERRAPGGACVCRVDGCLLALRRETAERLEVAPVV